MTFASAPPTAAAAQDEAKRTRILEGATQVFLAYGYQRTTMDDIARASEVSRPALYLLFRNKTDIYRALARDFLAKAMANATVALAGSGPLEQRLERAVSCAIEMVDMVEQSPHGAEILDMKNSLAADVVAEGRAHFGSSLTMAIAGEAARRGISVGRDKASAMADLLLDALDGMKLRGVSFAEQRLLLPLYIGMVLRNLED